jgi:hypothetical protein
VRVAATLVVALLTAVQPPIPQAPGPLVIKEHFAPDAARYQYLPFEVSPGTRSITVSYSVAGEPGASVIDLGLFEAGTAPGMPVFRGYSGGAQRTVTVGERSASPGYWSGPLRAGTWQAMLGLYKVAPAGVDVQLTVTESREDSAAPTPAAPASARPAATSKKPHEGWYSGALHLHTTHSDGTLGPAALAEAAGAAGLDFIAITDHNNTAHTRDAMPPAPLHIIGDEVTTPGGHASVWGLQDHSWLEFRIPPKDPGAPGAIAAIVDEAHRAGALFAIDHPFDVCGGCTWDQVIPDGLDALEIWNGEKGPQDRAIGLWDRLLRQGRRITAVGASDWHRPPSPIGAAAVRVFATALTEPAILDGLRQHRVIVMRDAKTAPPVIRAACGSQHAGVGDSLTCGASDDLSVQVSMPELPDGYADFIWNAVKMRSLRIGHGTTFTMPAGAGYLRVHVHAADDTAVAITNPVYVAMR